MKRIFCLLLLVLPLVATAAPMTNDDVIKLVKGGLGEATVLRVIDGAEPGFDTSPDGLVKLKQGGVSDAVAGNVIENWAPEGKTYEISVRFEDGSSRVFMQESHPAWQPGSRVKLVNGALAPR